MSPLSLASPLSPRRLKRLPLALLLAGSADKRWAISGVISRPSTKAGNS